MFRIVSKSSVVLPALPSEWPGGPADASIGELAAFVRHSSACTIEPVSDAAYVVAPVQLLRPLLQWTLLSIREQIGRPSSYVVNAWDCEDFRTELCQTFRKVAARAGIEKAPLIGGLDVRQVNGWGGVAPGGAHAVAAIFTQAGWWVVESQNGEAVPLEAYPNRSHIIRARGF
jgi:hypothetical protein